MTINQQLREFSRTDQGNAQALAFLFGHELRFCKEQAAWYRWNGNLWEQIVEGEVRQLSIATASKQLEAWKETGLDATEATKNQRFYWNGANRRSFVAAVATASELSELRISITDFNSDKWLLGLENGYLDLRTLKFHKPDPKKFLTMKASVAYDPAAKCPKWDKFFAEIFSNNLEVMDFVQRADGYCLTGSVEEQLMFLCVGDGANGKSTYLNVKRDMLGDYSKACPFSTFSAKNRSEMTNDLARLMGARYVTIIESDEDASLAEAKIKQATGGDPIPCRYLNKEFFEYIPEFKIWMAANKLPVIKGTDHGNFRRPVIIPFNRRFDASERVVDLQEQLYAERAGILNWMLEGLKKWKERKLITNMPQSLVDSKSEYQTDMDITGKWLAARTERDENARPLRSEELYQNYKEYVQSIGHYAKSMTTWGREMKDKVASKRTKKGITYLGLILQDMDWPETINVAIPLVKAKKREYDSQ